MVHPLAGKPAPASMRLDVGALLAQYSARRPDPANPEERVAFGTSGHRGSAARGSFNEAHIAAVTQALCEHRKAHGIDGPLFLGADSHALSEPAQRTALEVLAAHGVAVRVAPEGAFTPTPAVSRAIVAYNRGRTEHLADGIVVTPSHNPPEDGGFKYNPPHGGPADTDVTRAIEERANALLGDFEARVQRIPYERARKSDGVADYDFVTPYVEQLALAVDLEVIAASKLRLGADPLGGASVAYWGAIAERYKLDLTVVNPAVDPTFGFLCVDHDGKLRMDCSSPYAMASLVALRDRYDLAFGNDADADRHGVVTRSAGLLNPNHYLAVAIAYLYAHRPAWKPSLGIGKTLVSSALIDRVAADLGRTLVEVPVGFKWFVQGLAEGTLGFGGEESAGASFLCRDGSTWSTDKDGLLLDLLAAELFARTGKDPGEHYAALVERLGAPAYTRIDAPATKAQKNVLKKLSPSAVKASTLAGDAITATLTRAPGNNAELGGLKVCTAQGWFAARPSGTEDVYKIYAESFRGAEHLEQLVTEARALVTDALAAG